MTNKQYHDILDDIGAQAQPAHFSIKQNVRQQLKFKRSIPQKVNFQWRQVATMLILLVFSGIAYGVYYQQQDDAGRDYVYTMELGQVLNIQDRVEGVAVTLTWAYADANRMILEYQSEESLNRPVSIFGGLSNTTLTTLDGIQLPTKAGNSYTDDSGIGRGTIGFDTRVLSNSEDSVTFTLETSVFDLPNNQTLGQLSYQFTIPFYEGDSINIGEQQIQNGLAIDLESVFVTPSMTLTTVCYDLPTSDPDWRPDAQIVADGTAYEIASMTDDTIDPESANRQCVDMQFSVPANDDVTQFDLVITAIETPPDFRDSQAVIDAFAEYGVQINLAPTDRGGGGGGAGDGNNRRVSSLGMNIIANPNNVDTMALLENEITDRFRERELGAWQFTILLTDADE